MPDLTPIYTRDTCRFSCPLQWGLTVFWRKAQPDDGWHLDLAAAVEPDGVRLLSHRFSEPDISQFAVSTQAQVSPLLVVQRVKGRLQYLLRQRLPKAFHGNYVRGMKPIYEYGGFIGTVGEYTTRAM